MAANIASNLATWSTTAASNQPDSTDPADLVSDLQQIQSVVRKYLRTIGTNIASASTTDLANATGDYVSITGTTTITALGTVSAGMRFILSFAGALTLTHNATSLNLPTGADIETKAGDIAVMESLGSGNWKCIHFSNSSGDPFLNSGTSAVTRSVEAKLRELPVNVKDFGCVGDGVTDDTTAYTAALTEAVNNKRTLLIPYGNYLVSAVNYDVRGDFIWRDTGFGAVDAIGKAETANVLLTGKTPNTTPSDPKQALTLLSLTNDIYGSHHGNAARFNAVSRSDHVDGNTSVYVMGNTTADNGWMAALHSECKHGGGTTIGLNIECSSYETTGTFIGHNIQNVTDTAPETHPQTSEASVEFVASEALTIRGGTTAKGKWKYGVYVKDDGIKTTGSSFRTDSAATYGIHVVGANTGADVYLYGDSANGLVCAGSYSGNAIRINESQFIAYEGTGVIKTGYIAADTRWKLFNSSTERFGIDVSNGDVYKSGTKILGNQGTAIADALTGTTVTTINAILAALRTHGLIAT